MKIAVIGGGVIGLSVANVLAKSDHRVTIFSPQPLSEITSSVAAAFWRPFWIGQYDRELARQTLTRLLQLAADRVPGVNVQRFEEWLTADAVDEATRDNSESHWWRSLPGIDIEYLPQSAPKRIWLDQEPIDLTMQIRFNTVVARMPDYLQWLQDQAIATGQVEIREEWIESLDTLTVDPEHGFDRIVNCTGWGAKHLVKDDPETAAMQLLAGHVVLMDCPEIYHGMLFHGKPFEGRSIYIVPRSGSTNDVLCGGSALLTEPLPDVRQSLRHLQADHHDKILARVIATTPALATAKELSRGTGLRPVRSTLRLEWDHLRPNLLHCYGHGGSGLTLSWGSAHRVADLIDGDC